MRFLMCKPTYFDIQYEINPWMKISTKSVPEEAHQQWQKLYDVMKGCGAEIDLVPPHKEWPDMVFTANAGLFYKNRIIISHFKYKERQGEAQLFADWFEKHGFALFNDVQQTPPYFEGAGDALPIGDLLFVGYGFRTDRAFFEAPYFDQGKIIYCELVDPYYYHIDTCFCPLNDETAIWYPDAFSEDAQKTMSKTVELIDVSPEEAKFFACNAVVIGENILLPERTEQLAKQLTSRGFTTHHIKMDEFLKSGGACKCLTLRIDV